MTMSFSMNVTVLSAKLRTPVGAFIGSLLAASRNTTMLMMAAAAASRPTLLKFVKMSRQRISSLIGGNVSPSIRSSPSLRTWLLRWTGSDQIAWLGLQCGVSERHRHVLELPHQQAEVRDDDGGSEGRQRNPTGVFDEKDGEEDQAEAE